MKTNVKVNPELTIRNLLGVLEALKDLVETKQILLKQSLPLTLRRLYEKQIFAVSDKIEYVEEMILQAREQLELTTELDEQKSFDIDNAITRVFENVSFNNLKSA